jgi:ribose transport system ATP-binding protein
MENKKPMLKMANISKSFPGVKALEDVKLSAYGGEVTALMGENGAGKSTLMKILSGVYKKDTGTIEVDGEVVEFNSIKEAEGLGITIIHQELSVISNLTIAENIFLGNEKVNNFTRRIDKKVLNERSKMFLEQIGCKIDSSKLVKDISVGERQMIEIAKALTKNSKIIIMDEPTTALTDVETKKLFQVIKNLKEKGIAIVYISHRMEEIFEICDKVVVLRDGKYVGEEEIKNIDNNKLINMMVGRNIEEQFPYKEFEKGQVLLEVKNLSFGNMVKQACLQVREGEILGIAGLMGSGRTELAKTIFGEYKHSSGEIYVEGKKVRINCPKDAINNGICYVSEDRKKEGLVLGLSVGKNMTLSNIEKYENMVKYIDRNAEQKDIEEYIKKLNVKTPSSEQLIKNLSGGNQQKVILAKWLLLAPRVLIIDEPTRGIDVGAKKEIYELLNELKAMGKAIIMISSDLPEVLGISDRILVVSEGRISGELARKDANQESVMKLAVGIK